VQDGYTRRDAAVNVLRGMVVEDGERKLR
jgi:hypothetical protein